MMLAMGPLHAAVGVGLREFLTVEVVSLAQPGVEDCMASVAALSRGRATRDGVA